MAYYWEFQHKLLDGSIGGMLGSGNSGIIRDLKTLRGIKDRVTGFYERAGYQQKNIVEVKIYKSPEHFVDMSQVGSLITTLKPCHMNNKKTLCEVRK